ncbi:hypothetical protein Daus18300_010731 [Diaporthe australafricana]|uniref:MULE transposase domain-containing protein n=1 Tax=Diaporthe australafricana TaxID=127596 RepID=A0ABR3W978_9PEZI
MPYFQGTALTHTKKILPLFQGVVDNERESGFRWLLQQVHYLLRECKAEDPTLFVTDYNNALINALESEFPHAHYQLCVFHININVVLYIKKKWRKPAGLTAAEEGGEAEEAEAEDPDKATLNAPARNKATIPMRVPNDVPYTRQALFDLLKFMEYSTDREVYETKFSDQTAILNYLKTYYIDDDEKIVAKWAGHQTCKTLNFGLHTTSSTKRMHWKVKVYLGHRLGNLLYLAEAVYKAISDTADQLRPTKGRPLDTATFAVDEEGIFGSRSSRGKAVMGKKTKSTTTSLSLDEEDSRGSDAQQETVRRDQRLAVGLTGQGSRKRGSEGPVSSAPAAIPSSSKPAAKKQRTGARRAINQLPSIDLTASDDDDDGEGGKSGEGGGKETQDEIVAIVPTFVA